MKEQLTIKQRAFKYYCMGLNSKEIAKLLDISYRTVQNYMTLDNWKQKRIPIGLPVHIQRMYKNGKSYNDIAEMLNVSRSTVYNYLKEMRAKQ